MEGVGIEHFMTVETTCYGCNHTFLEKIMRDSPYSKCPKCHRILNKALIDHPIKGEGVCQSKTIS